MGKLLCWLGYHDDERFGRVRICGRCHRLRCGWRVSDGRRLTKEEAREWRLSVGE